MDCSLSGIKLTLQQKDLFNQKEMFDIYKEIRRKHPGFVIASVKNVDTAIKKGCYLNDRIPRWVRTDQYAAYKLDPEEPLGEEVTWSEAGIHYKLLIPDVPIMFGEKEMNLQKVVGMVVYDSIDLLKLEQTDINSYTVSVVDPTALENKVWSVNFMRGGWALTDKHGFPLADQPSSLSNDAARYGLVMSNDSEESIIGWHGSVIRVDGYLNHEFKRYVYASHPWSSMSEVMLVKEQSFYL
ncbi:MAG: hypothetical protein AB1391_01750 [Candidatus Micrarchaeota archaeon]